MRKCLISQIHTQTAWQSRCCCASGPDPLPPVGRYRLRPSLCPRSSARTNRHKQRSHVAAFLSHFLFPGFNQRGRRPPSIVIHTVKRFEKSNQEPHCCLPDTHRIIEVTQHSTVSLYSRKQPERHEPAFPVKVHSGHVHLSQQCASLRTSGSVWPRPGCVFTALTCKPQHF